MAPERTDMVALEPSDENVTKQASPFALAAIGILGTGQLGRMLSLAGAQLGFKTHIYGPEENAPPSEVSWRTTTADYRDETALTISLNPWMW